MNITLDVSPELEGQLQQAARSQGIDVTTYLLDSARLRLRPDVLPQAEASLLQAINAPLAPEARTGRDALLKEQAQRQLSWRSTADQLTITSHKLSVQRPIVHSQSRTAVQ